MIEQRELKTGAYPPIIEKAIDMIFAELKKAEDKFHGWPVDPVHGVAILAESARKLAEKENKRLCESINAKYWEGIAIDNTTLRYRLCAAESERDRLRESVDLACDWIDSADLEDENGRSVAIQLRTVLAAVPEREPLVEIPIDKTIPVKIGGTSKLEFADLDAVPEERGTCQKCNGSGKVIVKGYEYLGKVPCEDCGKPISVKEAGA